MSSNLNNNEPSRQDLLKLYLYDKGISAPMLAKKIGITSQGVLRLLYRSNSMHPDRYQAFLELGIPKKYLPPAKIIPKGRKPRLLKEQNQ